MFQKTKNDKKKRCVSVSMKLRFKHRACQEILRTIMMIPRYHTYTYVRAKLTRDERTPRVRWGSDISIISDERRKRRKNHPSIVNKRRTLIFYVTGQQNRVILKGFYRRRVASEVVVRRSMRPCNKRIYRNYIYICKCQRK